MHFKFYFTGHQFYGRLIGINNQKDYIFTYIWVALGQKSNHFDSCRNSEFCHVNVPSVFTGWVIPAAKLSSNSFSGCSKYGMATCRKLRATVSFRFSPCLSVCFTLARSN